jgi:hypothetical protein
MLIAAAKRKACWFIATASECGRGMGEAARRAFVDRLARSTPRAPPRLAEHAEALAGGESGVAGFESLLLQVSGAEVHVEPHLFGQVVVHAVAASEKEKAAPDFRDDHLVLLRRVAGCGRWRG